MLRTRLWTGAFLVIVTAAALVLDARLGEYPVLFLLLLLGMACVSCFELLHLITGPQQPWPWLCYAGVALVVAANLPAHLGGLFCLLDRDPWHWILGAFTIVVLAAFLTAMATFREPGTSVGRMAVAVWMVAYLGLLPSFLAQLRWPFEAGHDLQHCTEVGTLSLALAVFVPKCGDIGAYFTGRFFGQHRLTPLLSPLKTWEGAAGGLAAAVAAAIGLNRLGSDPRPLAGLWVEAGFGLTVGFAGMLGDLAESLIKRDCRQKDASQAIPGFGGVLDVVDSIIVAAPVAFCWLSLGH